MNSKFLKKKLKIKNLIEIFNCSIVIITQTNLLSSCKELEFSKFLYKNDFYSLRISSSFLRNFLKLNFPNIKSLGSNNCQIFYLTKNIKKNNFINFLYFNKYSVYINFFLFSKFLNLKNYKFLNLYINFITIENFLLKFFSRMLNTFIIVNKGE